MMGAIKRWWNKSNAVKTTSGTSSAYTLTYDVAPTAYVDGEIIQVSKCVAVRKINPGAFGEKLPEAGFPLIPDALSDGVGAKSRPLSLIHQARAPIRLPRRFSASGAA